MATRQQKQVGEIITRLRRKAKLSGNALAKQAGISQPYLWQIEKGDKNPPLTTLSKIAQALDKPLTALIPSGG